MNRKLLRWVLHQRPGYKTKLHNKWTIEKAKELQSWHSIDAEDEFLKIFTEEVNRERGAPKDYPLVKPYGIGDSLLISSQDAVDLIEKFRKVDY